VEAAVLVLVALLARELWVFLLPLDGGNDEIFHLYTSQLYHRLGRLAVLGVDAGASGFFHPVHGFNQLPYICEPPGAHLVGAAFLHLLPGGPGTYLWLRQLSAVGGSLAVLLAYLALRAAWPSPSPVPAAATALFALEPQAVFLNSYYNDEWFALIAVGFIYFATALMLTRGLTGRALLLAAVGLAWLGVSRLTAWPSVLALGIAVARAWPGADRRRRAGFLLCLLLPLLTAGSWIGRNIRTYGAWDGGEVTLNATLHPVGTPPGFRVRRFPGQVKAKHPYLYSAQKGGLLRATFMSFWGVFGYMGLLMPAGYYLGWLALCLAAAAGGWLGVKRLQQTPMGEPPALPLVVAFAAVALAVLLAHLFLNGGWVHSYRFNYQPQGRYLFGALLPILTLLTLGLRELLRAGRREGWLLPLCVAVSLGANVWCLRVITSSTWAMITWSPSAGLHGG
jgi:hypothetical protein